MMHLPAGWTWATVGEVCEINPRRFDDMPDDGGLISKVPMAAVEAESGRLDASQLVEYGSVKGRSLTPFQENDVLFAKVTPCMENGKIALAEGLHGGRAVGSTELFALRSRGAVEPQYLMYYLLQSSVRRRAEHAMTGAVGLRRVPRAFLSSLPIPLPPLEEQRRIGIAVEGRISRLRDGISTLQHVNALLSSWREATLMRAFRGNLVEEDLSEGNASELCGGFTAEPVEGPWLLPDQWVWFRMGELFTVSVGATPSRSNSSLWGGGIPWVSSGEVAFNHIDHTRETISIAALTDPESRIHPPGTVMLAMIGEGKTRGQAAILDISAAHNQNCASIRVSETPILPEYIYWFLYLRYNENRQAASGGNQLALNKRKIQNILVPLAPLGTQRKIVTILESVDLQITRTTGMVRDATEYAQHLKEKIYSAAFSGLLGSNGSKP